MQLFCAAACFLFTAVVSLKTSNSPSAQTARIFTRLSQWFFTGNNQRLNNRHLRSDELFSEGSCSTPLPFLNRAVLVAVIPLVHLRYFLKTTVLRHFLSGVVYKGVFIRIIVFDN